MSVFIILFKYELNITKLLIDESVILHQITSMPPDGSCLFYSIAFSLYNSID